MMRSEKEVAELRDMLTRFNERHAEQLKTLTDDGEHFDEVAYAFNQNSQMLTVLDWILGDDTKLAFSRGTETPGIELGKR